MHQVLNSAEAEDMPAWLSRLREADSSPEMCGRLVEEANMLRRCIDWLRRMQRGESVVVNLRLDTDTETEYVPFDRARVMHILFLGRIASDLDFSGGRVVPSKGEDDPATRHRRQLAEPAQQPKKLSTREEQNALRAKLKLPPRGGHLSLHKSLQKAEVAGDFCDRNAPYFQEP